MQQSPTDVSSVVTFINGTLVPIAEIGGAVLLIWFSISCWRWLRDQSASNNAELYDSYESAFGAQEPCGMCGDLHPESQIEDNGGVCNECLEDHNNSRGAG